MGKVDIFEIQEENQTTITPSMKHGDKIEHNEVMMTEQEIRQKILRLSGLAGLYAESPQKEIFELGKPAIPILIDIFKNLALPRHGEVQEITLLLALDLFAREGDEEAIRVIQKIANGRVALKSGTAVKVMRLAKNFLERYKPKGGA